MNPLEAIPTQPGAVVVGGGIAGLVSAWEWPARRASPPD